MARTKRCLCVECKPATEKTALELIMFAKDKPKNEPKSPKLAKLPPKNKNYLDKEVEKKLNAKFDSMREEIKELETELDDFSIKKHQIGNFSEIGKENFKKVDDLHEHLRPFFEFNKSHQNFKKEANSIPEKEKTETSSINDKPKNVQGGFPTWIFDKIISGKYFDLEMKPSDHPDCSIMSDLIHDTTREEIKKYFGKNREEFKKYSDKNKEEIKKYCDKNREKIKEYIDKRGRQNGFVSTF